ncbi:hypothetical protein VARIO8X_120041 [Burkholderiales bacterium 8X]|nr:hypothetical protein VARIO8X_120041 [Burkholderiales bacterium 8X]
MPTRILHGFRCEDIKQFDRMGVAVYNALSFLIVLMPALY